MARRNRRFLCRAGCLLALAMPIAPAAAQPATVVIDTHDSALSYTGHHALHGWTGTSRSFAGTITLDPDDPAGAEVEIVVPVTSFDSGNEARDEKMRRLVEAERYPDVRFRSDQVIVERWEKTGSGYGGVWLVRGPLDFHGRTHVVEATVEVRVVWERVEATGSFPVSLGRFDVQRPRLVTRVRDTIDLAFTVSADFPPAPTPR